MGIFKLKALKKVRLSHFFLSLTLITIFCTVFVSVAMAADVTTNAANNVICNVILLIRGRLARAVLMFATGTFTYGMWQGNFDVKRAQALIVGSVFLFAAEGVVFIIVPSTVQGISGVTPSGQVFNPAHKYSPQELVRMVCPQLSMYN